MPTKPFSPAGVNLDLGTPATIPSGTMSVRMKRVAYYNSSRLAVGSTYSVSIEWGKWAVEQGYAEDLSGILPYQDSPAGLSSAETAAVQALVSGDGQILTRKQNPRVLFYGDSIVGYGSAVQDIIRSSSDNPYGASAFSIIAVSWKSGAGSGTLNFSKSAQTLQWTAPSDSAGTPVDVSRAGVYEITSGTAGKTITVVCRPRLYSASTEGSATVTTTAQTQQARRSAKSFPTWVHAALGSRLTCDVISHGGSSIADLVDGLWQVPLDYDSVIVAVGTNNIVGDASLATMQASYSQLIAGVLDKCKNVIVLPILPRSTSMNAARRLVLSGFNRWLYSINQPGVRVVNTHRTILNPDSTTGEPLSLKLEDGLHPAFPGAWDMSVPVVAALRECFSFEDGPIVSSAVDAYDATSNPLGNRLPNGGTFLGTGGTFATGGSGTLGDGWRIERNGSATDTTVVCSKVARTDGLPGSMQRLVYANPGATSQGAQLRLITPISVSAGEVWQARAALVASSMTGVEAIEVLLQPNSAGGEFVSSCGIGAVATFVRSGSLPKLVMQTYPVEVQAGTTSMQVWLKVRMAAGGGATIDCLPGEFELVRIS